MDHSFVVSPEQPGSQGLSEPRSFEVERANKSMLIRFTLETSLRMFGKIKTAKTIGQFMNGRFKALFARTT